MTKIANIPEMSRLHKYVVVRNPDGGKWWYWGTYDDLERATNAAKEIDGSIFEKDDVMRGSLLYGIDCHVVFQGEPPCLVEERELEMYPDDPKKRWARDEACAECKAIWLMGKYE